MHILRNLVLAAVGAVVAATGQVAFAPVHASAAPAALSPQDQSFLIALHQGNESEILSGTRAAVTGQGQCADVRQIGPVLVSDHSRFEASDVSIAVHNGLVLPLTPTAQQTQQLRSTGMKTGRDFDRAWLQMQVGFHTDALAAGKQELATGSSPEVKQLVRNIAPVIQHHLDLVNAALTRC